MKKNIMLYVSVLWLIIGGILVGMDIAGKVDEFWGSMGATLFVVGVLRLLRIYRFNKNETYREKMEIEETDERNHFIRNKAWAWSSYIFVIVGAVLTIVFRVFNLDTYSMAASMSVCFILLLFWISYYILRKKY